MAEIASFNENVLDDQLSDFIVRKLWKNDGFAEVVEDSGVEIGDICIMLKANTTSASLDNFRLCIELSLDEGEMTEDQLEVITDLVQEEFAGQLDNYQEDASKLINALKAFDPEWHAGLEQDDSVFDMLHDAISSSGGYVVEVVN